MQKHAYFSDISEGFHTLQGHYRKSLPLFNPRFDGLSRESGRGLAQEMQGGLVKPRKAPPVEIRAGQSL